MRQSAYTSHISICCCRFSSFWCLQMIFLGSFVQRNECFFFCLNPPSCWRFHEFRWFDSRTNVYREKEAAPAEGKFVLEKKKKEKIKLPSRHPPPPPHTRNPWHDRSLYQLTQLQNLLSLFFLSFVSRVSISWLEESQSDSLFLTYYFFVCLFIS